MSTLDQVKTVVVVMMENRSFDHLLGALSLPDYGGRTDIEGLQGPVDAATDELVNPAYHNYAIGHRWRPFLGDADAPLVSDLPHGRDQVATQLDWEPNLGGFTMKGFARSYFDANPGNRGQRPDSLRVFPPQLVPTTSFLAQTYAVCDHWFAPVPSDTQPNRFMALAGFTKIAQTSDSPPDHDIVTDWCDRQGVRWRVYHEGFSSLALFRKRVLLDPHFHSFDELADHFQSEGDATFPQLILVEPSYDDDPFATHPDDNHPPLPMGPGEAFLAKAYRAVTSNPERWAGTVMIVVYDEHGGFFDHVRPLPIRTTAPDGEYQAFETTGPRVPAMVVSPLVNPASVCKAPLDHTSILRFLGEKFGQGGVYSPIVSARHASGGLASVAAALAPAPAPAAARAVASAPPAPPRLGPVVSVTHPEPRVALTPSQRAFARARAEALASMPEAVAARHPAMLFHAPRARPAGTGAPQAPTLGPAPATPPGAPAPTAPPTRRSGT